MHRKNHNEKTIGKDLNKAASIIKNGGIVIYPTETVYGIGANILDKDALKKVFEIKKRLPDKPISIAVSSFEMMEELVYISENERNLITQFLPGAVTFLLRKKPIVPDILTLNSEFVGIRYPDHKTTLSLIELSGVPITSTSANISGQEPPKSPEEININVDYIIDGGECNSEPSTVVDIKNKKIIRKGSRYDEVFKALKNFHY